MASAARSHIMEGRRIGSVPGKSHDLWHGWRRAVSISFWNPRGERLSEAWSPLLQAAPVPRRWCSGAATFRCRSLLHSLAGCGAGRGRSRRRSFKPLPCECARLNGCVLALTRSTPAHQIVRPCLFPFDFKLRHGRRRIIARFGRHCNSESRTRRPKGKASLGSSAENPVF